MRLTALISFFVAVSGGTVAFAQSEETTRGGGEPSPRSEATDEVVVRGQRLTNLRFEVQAARERAFHIFNEINSDDDFDVFCREEGRTGTRATQRVCRPKFETRISAAAAKDYLAGLLLDCPGPGGVTQDCMFSPGAQNAISRAQAVEGQLPGKRDQMNAEILRLAQENPRFAQAIIDYYESSQRYEAARKRRD